MDTKAEAVATTPAPPMHPKNMDFPEIVTVTETNERVESTEERKLIYKTGTSKGTSTIKKLAVIHTTIRTTTPYTGTV